MTFKNMDILQLMEFPSGNKTKNNKKNNKKNIKIEFLVRRKS